MTSRVPRTTQRVLFDVSRLERRVGRAAPTGIDRVDLAHLEALHSMRGVELGLVAFDALGPRLLSRTAAESLLARARDTWHGPGPSRHADASAPSREFARLLDWLSREVDPRTRGPRIHEAPPSHGPSQATADRARGLLDRAAAPLVIRRFLGSSNRTAYVNTSHGGLYRPAVRRFLARPDVAPIVFVHDLIPIRYPQYNREQEPARHAARLDAIAAHAHAVLVNSDCTRRDVLAYWAERGVRNPPPIQVAHLGIDDAFDHASAADPLRPGTAPYFVVLGTIEPRKNHALLLDVWERLARAPGPVMPRLVLIGRRGWRNESVFARLDATGPATPYIVECAGLGDAEVATLVRGARALLSMSHAEGYNLPLAEALAVGTPAVASDLPVHREVGGVAADYLDLNEPSAWVDAVRALATDGPRRDRMLAAAATYEVPRWSRHFATLREILSGLAP